MDFRRQLSAELPVLRRFARALTGDPALADDLVQDCLERAMLKSHLYDPSRPLCAWLFTMLRNLHISGMRRNSRATVVKPVDDLMDGEGAVPPEQENSLAAGSVSAALAQLSPVPEMPTVAVSASATAWSGCDRSLSMFTTGTDAVSASRSTISCENTRAASRAW